MKKFLVLICFILACTPSVSQKRSLPEWCWAFRHPIAAVKVKMISKRCYAIYKTDREIRLTLDTFSNGGKLDAFRHIFFMAAFAQKVNARKVKQLGIAHEKGNYRNFKRSKKEDGELADSLSTVMDLKNNDVGIEIGKQFKKAPLDSLKLIVIKELKAGKGVIIRRRRDGLYTDCNGNIIDLPTYKGKWYVPKCIVNSGYIYAKL